MDAEVGSLLEVPFGGRKATLGVVTALATETEVPEGKLAEPRRLIPGGPPAELVELGLWVAHEYCSPPSRGVALALPPGLGTGKARISGPRTERQATLTPAGSDAVQSGQKLGERQRAVLSALAASDGLSAAELREQAGAQTATVNSLAKRGLVELADVPVRRRPEIVSVGDTRGPVELSRSQRVAAETVIAALAGVGAREQLLYGVTGSGKTEVYLAAIEAALARGRGAILLVPEIGLTPQTVARVRERLGEQTAVLHSALSEGERYDEWQRLRSGEARVCVGPRSAVFAPVAELGLIVVDEEHDSSYKQEGDPRYDARAVARRRAKLAEAVYLAGSATPRPESWAELDRLELPERVDGRRLPAVEILDMRDASPAAGPLHPLTRGALTSLDPQGGKAIVMLNRRGFAPFLSCGTCGAAVECPNCDVSLVYHREGERMACHHCGLIERVPNACPSCGSVALGRRGVGTEQLEALLRELVEPLPVFRLDTDTTSRKGAHANVLAAFDRAQAGVLVGTQMVAKGHDFSAVVLSVLLDADSTLRFPDFRAEERTFALVSQLAGRSGRGEGGGRVIVQTLTPEAAPILAAAEHDAAAFLAGELERRRTFGYPPFSALISVEMASTDLARVKEASEQLAAAIEPKLPAGSELLGPAPRYRRRGSFRRRLLIKAEHRQEAIEAVREGVTAAVEAGVTRELALAIDVDPQ